MSNIYKNYAEAVKLQQRGLPQKNVVVRVAGVSFDGRQVLLAQMSPKTKVKLERERRNAYDPSAVKVLAELEGFWRHVGYVPGKMSAKVARLLDSGVELAAKVHRVTGGFAKGSEQAHYGLEISLREVISGDLM